jgi:hypothetical protein
MCFLCTGNNTTILIDALLLESTFQYGGVTFPVAPTVIVFYVLGCLQGKQWQTTCAKKVMHLKIIIRKYLFHEGLANCLGERSITEMINKARDRNGWRYRTANVCRLDT